MRVPASITLGLALAFTAHSAVAQDRKGIRFWNLTLYTVTALQMSPAGADTGVEPGRYDVKLADKIGRICIVRNVEVKDGAIFAIEEKQLTDCSR
jgi:hypothetical protein